MALDIAVLGENGEPERTVSVGANDHARLLSLVNDAELPLLSRLTEYYEDAEYAAGELDALMGELDYLKVCVQSDADLVRLVAALVALVLSAKRSGRQIFAIAD